MTDVKYLIGRLRKEAETDAARFRGAVIIGEAADALEEITAENADLKKRVEELERLRDAYRSVAIAETDGSVDVDAAAIKMIAGRVKK
jgi:hypothetical protein